MQNELENKIQPLKTFLNFFAPRIPGFLGDCYVFFRCFFTGFVRVFGPNLRLNVEISRALPMLGTIKVQGFLYLGAILKPSFGDISRLRTNQNGILAFLAFCEHQGPGTIVGATHFQSSQFVHIQKI